MENNILKNTVLDIYPSYTKKSILKQVVDEGLAINNKKKSNQLTLNFNDCVDVTNDNTLDDKMNHLLERENILSFIEGYEYRKAYRHFCYFRYAELSVESIGNLVKQNRVNVFNRNVQREVDQFDKPTIYLSGEQIYLKFSFRLKNDTGKEIKYITLVIIDKDNEILEIRFDKVGISYKNSYTYYRDNIEYILHFLEENIGLKIQNIDFKAVVDYMKEEKDDITIIAQRMTRNGTTAYLEAYEDEISIIPILGELQSFIEDNTDLFDKDENTREIKRKLETFKKEIEEKSDMPMVKIRIDESGIKFGITHNYKETDFSLFMMYGELVGEKEMMSSVREYIMQCYRELNSAVSADSLPEKKM